MKSWPWIVAMVVGVALLTREKKPAGMPPESPQMSKWTRRADGAWQRQNEETGDTEVFRSDGSVPEGDAPQAPVPLHLDAFRLSGLSGIQRAHALGNIYSDPWWRSEVARRLPEDRMLMR